MTAADVDRLLALVLGVGVGWVACWALAYRDLRRSRVAAEAVREWAAQVGGVVLNAPRLPHVVRVTCPTCRAEIDHVPTSSMPVPPGPLGAP